MDRILFGQGEAIFAALPERVLANLRAPASENALVWNLLYPLAAPTLSLGRLMAIRPLAGSVSSPAEDEALEPYFWGFAISGQRLPQLDEALEAVDGPGQQTEVDVILAGQRRLVLIEAKNLGGLGRCARYASGRCPEVHGPSPAIEQGCRYWGCGEAAFNAQLDFGERPSAESDPPPCFRHYQLARTFMLGTALGARLGLEPHLWLLVPRSRWRRLRPAWDDFAERVRQEARWRTLRVLAWEDVRALGSERRLPKR